MSGQEPSGGCWSPACMCANARHCTAGVMERGLAGETQKIHPDREVCLLWAIPNCYPEHMQRNMLKGNMFILYLIWDFVCLLFPAMCSLGFRADTETLEANLKAHLDQEFTLETLSSRTPCFLLCKDKITRTITCLAGKHHVHHVSFKRHLLFAIHAYCKTGKTVNI